MVLNIVMSIMTGFEHELREKIVGTNSHIVVRSLSGRIRDWQKLSDEIRELSGIVSVAPYSYHQGLIRNGNRSGGVLVRGILPEGSAAEQLSSYLKALPINGGSTASDLLTSSRAGGGDRARIPPMIIGAELQRTLGVLVGDVVSVLSPQVTSTPFGLVPRYRRFLVTGVYSSGLIEYESSLVYVNLSDAQRFFELGRDVSGIEIRIDDIFQAPRIAEGMKDLLLRPNQALYAQDWTITNKPLWDALGLEKRVYFIVLLLIIVMASFSVVTTLIMIVLEKRRDIAVLRTMGASSRAIGKIFQIQGSVIGGVGTVVGSLLGLTGCLLLRHFGFPLDQKIFPVSEVPVHMDPLNFFIIALSAFGICFVATLYPAYRASRVDPGQGLRAE
jgi:lipoprotein-releasing system permease protein